MIIKTEQQAVELVSKHYDLVVKGKRVNYINGEFYGYELIAKGNAILDILTRPALNRNQKNEFVEIIKKI